MPVYQDPQYREKIRVALDLIDNHKTFESFEGKHWIAEPCHILWVFQVIE
jgi:hypothetical protein